MIQMPVLQHDHKIWTPLQPESLLSRSYIQRYRQFYFVATHLYKYNMLSMIKC